MIRIRREDLRTVREEARAAYGEECCGALLGAVSGEEARVRQVVPIDNSSTEERKRRYLIGPEDVRRLEDQGARTGLDLIGFYHSHPDHPAIPSAFDRDHAWPWYRYIIVPVAHGMPGDPRAWVLSEDRGSFIELGIYVETDALQEAS